jgi:hypothetical protein
MAVLLITYDLNRNPTRKYDYEEFHNIIESYPGKQLTDSSCVIITEKSQEDLCQKLQPCVDEDDLFYVVTIHNMPSCNRPSDKAYWLSQNFPQNHPN